MSPDLTEYLRECTLRGHRPATLKARRRIVGTLERHAAAPAVGLTTAQVEAWYRTYDRLSPQSRRAYGQAASAFYVWAVRRGLREDNPAALLPIPGPIRTRPRPLTPADVRTVLAQSPDDRMTAWLSLGLMAGLRLGEIARIERAHVADRDAPPIVYVVNGKGGRDRAVVVGPRLVAALRPFLAQRGRLWDVTPGHAGTVLRRYFHALGMPDVTPHRLRHTFGTALYQASRDIRLVQEQLGHASPVTTAIYAGHATDAAERAIVALEAGWAA